MIGSAATGGVTVIEVAGVAGSGKSTLAGVLCDPRNNGVLDDVFRFRDPRHMLLAGRSLPRLSRLMKAWVSGSPRPTWTELKLLIYLQEWPRDILRRDLSGSRFLVMDQGPVYALARLGCLDPSITGTEPHGRWWTAMSDAWSSRLGAVVWLDAPNDVLLERVNERTQAHEIKGHSPQAAEDFVNRYRASYEEVLAAFAGAEGPALLRYDTSSMGANEIATDAIERLGESYSQPTITDGETL